LFEGSTFSKLISVRFGIFDYYKIPTNGVFVAQITYRKTRLFNKVNLTIHFVRVGSYVKLEVKRFN